MSNLSDDTLRKILNQIQAQAVTSQRSLSLVRSQIQSKEKDRKILQLTAREIAQIPRNEEVAMYRGVGKMFIKQSRPNVEDEQRKTEKSLTEDITTLSKKAKYLEKQFDEANNQLKDIFHSQRREQ